MKESGAFLTVYRHAGQKCTLVGDCQVKRFAMEVYRLFPFQYNTRHALELGVRVRVRVGG